MGAGALEISEESSWPLVIMYVHKPEVAMRIIICTSKNYHLHINATRTHLHINTLSGLLSSVELNDVISHVCMS